MHLKTKQKSCYTD